MGLGILLALTLSVPAASPQDKGKSADSDPLRLQEAEIMGKLEDVLGSYKLLEAEIVGTVERPGLNYIIPWRKPEPFLLEETGFRQGFLKEIYTPIDRDLYTREMEIRSR